MPPLIKKILLAAGASLMLASPVLLWLYSPHIGDDPVPVLSKYLRSLYARDLGQAYRFISTVDQQIKKRDDYVRERGAFTGFALDAARKLAESKNVNRMVCRYQEQPGTRFRSYKICLPQSEWDNQRLRERQAIEQIQMRSCVPGAGC